MSNNKEKQRQLDGLQKLHEQLNRKILHLRTSRVTAIDPGAIFSIDAQLEELEAENDKVKMEIEEIEKQQELQATVKKRTEEEVKAFHQDNKLYIIDGDKHNSSTTNQPTMPPENLASKHTILAIASSPSNQVRLRLDKEVREIKTVLRQAKQGANFSLEQREAVRPDDLQDALLDVEPLIVHFGGHGTGVDGLALENEVGETQLVSTDALARLFKLLKSHVQCVVLNACYSEVQAEAISQHIEYVIGMKQAIPDVAAINFSKGFYRALGNGKSFEEAFEFGCNAIDLQSLPDYLTPVLKKRPV